MLTLLICNGRVKGKTVVDRIVLETYNTFINYKVLLTPDDNPFIKHIYAAAR